MEGRARVVSDIRTEGVQTIRETKNKKACYPDAVVRQGLRWISERRGGHTIGG